MIRGTVTRDGVPVIHVVVADQLWVATIDTGFNGDLELPSALWPFLEPRLAGQVFSLLASGQEVRENAYDVEFPFDGQTVEATVTFAPGDGILLGTRMLQNYRLEIHFPDRTVVLDRVF